MNIKVYNIMSDDAIMVRQQVFVQEQGFKDEFDDIDKRAIHIVMYDDNSAIATCRIFEDEEKGGYILGRLAVVSEYRGKNLGAQLLKESEKIVTGNGGTSISLHAQCRVKDFYKKSGYTEYGEIEDDQGCPHIWMHKKLEGNANE